MMKSMKLLALAAVCAILASCGTTTSVPITGRKQHLLVSDQQVLSLSGQQYQDYMKTAKPSTEAVNTAMVKRVGQRLASAVTTYLQRNGMGDEVKNYQWEFNLVQNKQVNAFCMPGGKIVVYEGILPVTKDEASLAIVLGHEIAHAVAKHSAERLSNSYRQQYGMQILGGVAQAAGVDADDARYLMSMNVVQKDMYDVNDDHIAILYKDGTIRDIAEASEILNVELLSKKIRKYYLCYQRF